MRKTELRDVLVFLPGIGGSVLQTKDGAPLWAPSARVAWRFLTGPGAMLTQLRLEGDDPQRELLDDGIRATGLVADAHLIPGLWKIDGYSGFREMMTEAFELQTGSTADADSRVANYYDFPYDWRRDNRFTARRLQRFVDDRLHRWRKGTPFRDAKVIIIAHSMGGLVARYYLEVLGGWRDCRALITIGTPFRGSVKALDFLANGHRVLFSDLTDVVRSLTSVYQLLPRYRMLEEGGSFKRVAETEADIPGVERARALDALRFHGEIDDAVSARAERGYELVPIVGTWQPTLQSARLVGGRVTVGNDAPTWTEFPEGEGDGTVPRVSAVPVELSSDWLNTFRAERHASLQNNAGILQDLQDRLIHSQVRTDHIRGALKSSPEPALALEVDDIYLSGEPIALGAAVRNVEAKDIRRVRARLWSVENGVVVHDADFVLAGEGWSLTLPPLPPGTYRVELSAQAAGGGAPSPVRDIFAVAEG